MITLKISAEKDGQEFEITKVLDDIHDVKDDYDCKVIRDLLDELEEEKIMPF